MDLGHAAQTWNSVKDSAAGSAMAPAVKPAKASALDSVTTTALGSVMPTKWWISVMLTKTWCLDDADQMWDSVAPPPTAQGEPQ